MTTLTVIQTVGSPTYGPIRWTPRTMSSLASAACTFAATIPSLQVIFIARFLTTSVPSQQRSAQATSFRIHSRVVSGHRRDNEDPQRAMGRRKAIGDSDAGLTS